MIRTVLGCFFVGLGVLGFILAILGNYKFSYILSRMHAGGIGDSFALSSFMIGCIILNGFSITSAKLLVAMVCLYFTSPVCSHMLARLECELNEHLKEDCEVDL